MKIGSHNSLSYLPPKHWWMRPFAFMARCQRVDYIIQYLVYDVRVFDLRVWFDKTGNIQIRHGRMLYDIDEVGIYLFLSHLNAWGDCSLRVILEEDKRAYHLPYSGMAEMWFRKFCDRIVTAYPRIRFFGGNRKLDWRPLYDFGNDVELDDKYSSTTSLFKSNKKWLAKLDDLWPWLYARLHNKENFERLKDAEDATLFVDFVDIR